MKKAVIVIQGVNEGKTTFSLITKNEEHKFRPEDGFWIWEVNPNNVLGVAAKTLGSSGIRDNPYYDFIGELKILANKYWDFEAKYIDEMVNKFNGNDKVDLLIVHGLDNDLVSSLKADYGVFTLMITSSRSTKDFTKDFDKVLVWDAETFAEDVVQFLNILTEKE
jgi:hypothetical protein